MKRSVLVAMAFGLLTSGNVAGADVGVIESEPTPIEHQEGLMVPSIDIALTTDKSQGESPGIASWAFNLDQDLWTGPLNEDRNYTMGLAFNITGDWVQTYLALPLTVLDYVGPRWMRKALEDREQGDIYTATLGSTAFTPRCLAIAEPIHFDRPYASLLFLNIGRTSVFMDSDLAISSELTLGALGLPIAKGGQTLIHRALRHEWQTTDTIPLEMYDRCKDDTRSVDPKGWHHQISHGGAPTARYATKIRYRIASNDWFDSYVDGSAEVGYYTSAGSGFFARFGKLESAFWFHEDPFDGVNRFTAGVPFEVYGFAGIQGNLYAYNALLQGQGGNSSNVVIRSEDVERFVYSYRTGVTLFIYPVELTWVILAGKSPELKIGELRHHFWGGIYLTFHRA